MDEESAVLQLDDRLPEYILSGFRSFAEFEQHIERFTDFDVLILLLKGELCFLENGIPIRLKKGDWYIQKSGKLQSGLKNSSPPHYFYIHFYGAYETHGRGLPVRGAFPPEAIEPMLHQLHLAESRNAAKVELTQLFYAILTQLYSLHSNETYKLANEVRLYLAAHSTEEIKIAKLAKKIGYSSDYIIRSFKKAFDITPYQYIINLRVSHAKRLLLTTGHTSQEISEQVGFGDSISLYKAFKRLTGKSPKQWKSMFKKL